MCDTLVRSWTIFWVKGWPRRPTSTR